MDLIFKIAGIGIVISILNEVLEKIGRKEQALMVSVTGLVVVLIIVAGEIAALFEMLRHLFEY